MKKRVQYIDLGFCEEGKSALVMPLDHTDPSLNRTWVRTSTVLGVIVQAEGIVFETKNTLYWPAPTDESEPKANLVAGYSF